MYNCTLEKALCQWKIAFFHCNFGEGIKQICKSSEDDKVKRLVVYVTLKAQEFKPYNSRPTGKRITFNKCLTTPAVAERLSYQI